VLRRRLGHSDFQASILGFGGIPIEQRSEKEAVSIVRRAIELGVNLIDTARSYGDSENKIGAAIKGRRDSLFIATKSHFRTKREVAASIEESQRRLDIDTLDLMQLHSVDSREELEGCLAPGGPLEAIEEARAAGRVRYIGISGHQNGVLVQALKTGRFDMVMASYNLGNTDAEKELFPLARELDVGVITMKPLGGGYLRVPPEAIEFQVAERAISTAEAALRFVLANPHISTTVCGMGSVEEVEANVALGARPLALDPEEATRLKERASTAGYTFCQGCGYCLPLCPEGINIQEVFRLWVFHDQYGLGEYARYNYREYHREMVDSCTECQACTERCPARLEIPRLLREAAEILNREP
jgi:hypothetical protein